MKKILLILLILLSFSGLALSFAPKRNIVPSDYHLGITYKEAITQNKPALVFFYVDWCTYCKKFMPKLKILNLLYKDKYNIVMINGDDLNNRRLLNDYKTAIYPTLYIIDYKYNSRIHLDSENYDDIIFLKRELDRYLNVRKLFK